MEQTLTITQAQSDYLGHCHAVAESATACFRAAFTVLVRGHEGCERADLVKLDGTSLIIKIPDA